MQFSLYNCFKVIFVSIVCTTAAAAKKEQQKILANNLLFGKKCKIKVKCGK